MASSQLRTARNENVQKTEIKVSDQEIFSIKSNQLPYVFLRYGKKLLRDAAVPTTLLVCWKLFNFWDNYVTNYHLLQTIPTYISYFLPSSFVSMTLLSHLFNWMSSEVFLFIFLSMVIHEIVYFTLATFYTILNTYNLLSNYRIPRDPSVPHPSPTLIRNTLYEIPVSHFLIQPLLYFTVFPFFKYCGMETFTAIPNPLTCFYQFICMSIVTDFFYYSLHRFAHLPSFYPYHRKHHQYKRPIAIASDYCSFIERITLRLIPLIISPMLLGVHTSVWLAWLFLRTYENIEAHSGYDFPYLGFGTSRCTDYHHSHTLGNYGIGDFWDSIFGSNISYLRHSAKVK